MKKSSFLMAAFAAGTLFAQEALISDSDVEASIRSFQEKVKTENIMLPKAMTQHEKEMFRNAPPVRSLGGTRAPSGDFYGPAEFEQAEAVLLSWKGWDRLLTQMTKFIAEDYKVIISYDYNKEEIASALKSAGVKMANVDFFQSKIDAVWMRDFGPWWIYTDSGKREIIDLKYYRGRPNDDNFPIEFGQAKKIAVHKCPMVTEGGNIMLDGKGVAIVDDVMLEYREDWGIQHTKSDVARLFKDYFHCDKLIVLEKLVEAGGTGHIDIQAKSLTDTTIIVGQLKKSSDGAGDNYDRLNRNAKLLAGETNGEGKKFNIVRIPMPADPKDSTFTYTNSLIINKKVLVPIFGLPEDEKALQVYRDCLPGYDVRGFMCKDIIEYGGAIHCITKLFMAEPVKLSHRRPKNVRGDKGIAVSVKADAVRGLNQESVKVFWSNSQNGDFQEISMTEKDGVFTGMIPAQAEGTKVFYYFTAEDMNGMYKTAPDNAPAASTYMLTVK